MSDLHRVELPAYAGPMDLLLYLVKRHEIDLNDIPMATLVSQFMAHLRSLQTIDVDRAGDFLVMAATLVEVKSRTLAAHHQQLRAERDGENAEAGETLDEAGELAAAAELGEAADPRRELVDQLLAYKRFRDAAHHLEDRADEWERRFGVRASPPAAPDEPADEVELDLDDVNILDLSAAFGRVMESIGHLGDHQVTYDDTPISLHAEDIADRLARDGRTAGDRIGLTLLEVFEGRSRSEMIGLFLATLELVRQRRVLVEQSADDGGDGVSGIRLVLNPDAPEADLIEAEAEAENGADANEIDVQPGAAPEPAEAFDPDAFDWPDAHTRRRAERRTRLRAEAAEAAARGESRPLLDEEADDLSDASDDEAAADGR